MGMNTRNGMRLATVVFAVALLLVAQAASRTANRLPTVAITAPANGSAFVSGTTLNLAASASDADGSIARVDFYADGNLVGRDTSAPFAARWSSAAVGSHTLTAVATDNRKAKTTSSVVIIRVDAASDLSAPGVPSNLAGTGRGQTTLSLQWSPSTDNIGGSGVAGYDVFRDGVRVGSTTSPAFSDSALTPSTGYSYTVRARDVAGNASAQSAPLILATADAATATPRRVVGYFTQWGIYDRGYFVRALDANGTVARLTHVNYAFGNVRNNRCEVGVLKAVNADTGEGGDAYADYSRTFSAAESVDGVADTFGQPLRGNWTQLRKLKARHPGLKVLISLGGWTWSRGFAQAARPENRQAFVASCIDAYIRGNLPAFDSAGGANAAAGVFDGFDIDWEFPASCGLSCGGPEDTDNFTGLLAEFRRQLDAIRPGLQLTVAVGAGIDKIRVTRPDLYAPYVDAINLMAYDFHGSWDAKTNFHSALFNSPADPSSGDAALYNSNDAVQALLDRGVPAAKIILGMASYGRGWTQVGALNHGLYQPGVVAPGSEEAGVETYARLKTLGWPVYADSATHARWIYNGSTFWSFDDPVSIADKMAYVKLQELGGAFLWDFSGDDPQGALLAAIGNGLG
jgi:chitinase